MLRFLIARDPLYASFRQLGTDSLHNGIHYYYIYISGSACSTVGVHSQAWSTSGIGRLGSKSIIIISGSACSTGGVHSQAWSTSGIGLGIKRVEVRLVKNS
jgi:type IV secretory pathway TrbD component